MRIFKIMMKVTCIVYLFFGVLLFIFQRDFLYFPSEESSHNYQVEQFSINEALIKVIVLNQGMDNAILYFGGNGESVVSNASGFVKNLPDHTVYLVNYRGYGGSTGAPTEQGLYHDAQIIFDKIAPQYKSIAVIGRSLGTGVATYLASIKNIDKLILVTPYDSVEHIAQDIYPFYPISYLLLDKYNSVDRIENIKAKTLVILAQYDEVIAEKYSNALIMKFPQSQLKVTTISGTGHNNLADKAQYFYLLQNFI